MEQRSGVELDEFHVAHGSFGAVHHGDAVACGYERIRGGGVDGAYAACGHHRGFGEECGDLPGGCVEHIGSVAVDVGRAACDDAPEVVLRYYLDGEMVLEHVYARTCAHGLYEALLDFIACVVGMMEDAEFRVASLAVQVVAAVGGLVEVDTPLHETPYLLRRTLHHLLHGGGVAEPVAGHHGVVDVLVEVVHGKIGHRRDTALSQSCVGLVETRLAHKGHAASCGRLQCEAHAGDARADHEEVIAMSHSDIFFRKAFRACRNATISGIP